MKTYLVYGSLMAFAGAVVTIVLYLLGLHSDVARLPLAQIIGVVAGLAIGIGGLVLGLRARRAETPPHEEFGYGRAVGAGAMISLVNAVLTVGVLLVYNQAINPEFQELTVQSELRKLESQPATANMSAAQREQVEKMMRFFTSPGIQAAFGFVGSMLFGTLISLVVAAFVRRPAPGELVSPPPIPS